MQAPMVSEMFGEACPASAPFFGYMGAAAALIFASAGPSLAPSRCAPPASPKGCSHQRRRTSHMQPP